MPQHARKIPFVKMQGLLNDYVYLNGWRIGTESTLSTDALLLGDAVSLPVVQGFPMPSNGVPDDGPGQWLSQFAIDVSRRDGTAIGADGAVWIGPSASAVVSGAALPRATMRMFNADGSEAMMCGNGLRCAARVAAVALNVAPGVPFDVLTRSGVMTVRVFGDASCSGATSIDLPAPKVASSMERVTLIDGTYVEGAVVSVGNPHFVVPCWRRDGMTSSTDDASATMEALVAAIPRQMPAVTSALATSDGSCAEAEAAWRALVARVGRGVESHPRFNPARTNVEFVNLAPLRGDEGCTAAAALQQWTWERGSGETAACGTGACAVAATALRFGWCTPQQRANGGTVEPTDITVRLRGGTLTIRWSADDDKPLQLTGSADYVFEGYWALRP